MIILSPQHPRVVKMRTEIDSVLESHGLGFGNSIFLRALLCGDTVHYIANQLTDVEITTGITERIELGLFKLLDSEARLALASDLVALVLPYRDEFRPTPASEAGF
jgi:hypothetical protein